MAKKGPLFYLEFQEKLLKIIKTQVTEQELEIQYIYSMVMILRIHLLGLVFMASMITLNINLIILLDKKFLQIQQLVY